MSEIKLAACYNVWDGEEHLLGSMRCLKGHVDLFIIVYQNISNFGEAYEPLPEKMRNEIAEEFGSIVFMLYEPTMLNGFTNETNKRNLGIEMANKMNCTHFLLMDCDEYYFDFERAKKIYFDGGYQGSVCNIVTYFAKPTLRHANIDNYFVPFIHPTRKHTVTGTPNYPFYVDPTRRINEANVMLLPVIMHHYSWVRKDIHRKCRNSSAKANIDRIDWQTPYNNAAPGMEWGGQKLIEVPDLIKWPH